MGREEGKGGDAAIISSSSKSSALNSSTGFVTIWISNYHPLPFLSPR